MAWSADSLGLVPAAPAQQQMVPVIDVGGSPNAPMGEPGSQFMRSSVSPNGQPNAAPTSKGWTPEGLGLVPVQGAPSQETPSSPSAPAASPQQPQVASTPNLPPAAQGNIWLDPNATGVGSAVNTALNAAQSAIHGATFGGDQILRDWQNKVFGTPVAPLNEDVQRKQFETAHPIASGVAEMAGAVASPVTGLDPLAALRPVGAGLLPMLGRAAANAVQGGVGGALYSAGTTDGSLADRVNAAGAGAAVGAGLGAGLPAIGGGIGSIWRGVQRVVRPQSQMVQNALVGRMLGESSRAPLQFEQSPVPAVTVNTAQSTNNPGVAALARLRNEINQNAARAEQTAQNAQLRGSFTGAGGTEPPLSTGASSTAASERMTEAMPRVNSVIRKEENRLWTTPALQSVEPDLTDLSTRVKQKVAAMPPRFRREIEGVPQLKNALDDLQSLPAGAKLADVNAVVSDIGRLARELPHDQRFAKMIASEVRQAAMEAIENNPALRANPRAWADYQKARAFTARKWDLLGYPQFQGMLKNNQYGNLATDAGTAASKAFNMSAGTEKTPGGIANIGKFLNEIRDRWNSLKIGGVKGFDPVDAAHARIDLEQSARDFIISKALDFASSNVLDEQGRQLVLHNRLNDWIETNKGWIKKSGLFDGNQVALLERIQKTTQMLARTENNRGGKNSATYERLAGHSFVDALLGSVMGRVVGAGTGALLGYATEGAHGAVMGAVLGHQAKDILGAIYHAPREKALALLDAALRDPKVAADLLRKASAANAGMLSPATRTVLRNLGIYGGVSATVRANADANRAAAQ